MTEFVDALRAAVERHKGEGRADKDLGMTMVGRTTKGLPVRPSILETRADGTKVYALTVAQCRRLLEATDAEYALPREDGTA